MILFKTNYLRNRTKTIIILVLFNLLLFSTPIVSIKAYAKLEDYLPIANDFYKATSLREMFEKYSGKDKSCSYETFTNTVLLLDKDAEKYDNSKFPCTKMLRTIVKKRKRVDVGDDYISDVLKNNNRLDYYDLYIKLAKKKGYIVTDYCDYLTNYKDTNQKVLILRHDIDVTDTATQQMFEIEKKNNVKATYYFRWSTFDKELIQEISKEGFEVGLHYETIATYCIQNENYNIDNEDIEKCREILKNEIKKFKEESGVNIQTISSHGNPVNKSIKMPNWVLFNDQNYKDYGIVGETYDKDIINHYISSYICDGELTKNGGFSYRTNPINSIIKNDRVIEFLSHPNHWNFDVYKRSALYIKLQNNSFD